MFMRVVERAVFVVIALILMLLLAVLIAAQLSLQPTAQQASTPAPPQIPPPSPRPSPELGAAIPAPSVEAAPSTSAAAPPVSSATVAVSVLPSPSVLPTDPPAVLVPAPVETSAAPSANTGITLPGQFEAEDYNAGGEGVGYHDWTQGNQGGAYREDDVDIERCAAGSSCYDVAWVGAGEWLAYTVQVSTTASYVFTVRVAAPRRGARFHIEVNAANVTGSLQVPQSGGYDRWVDVVSQPVLLPAGVAELRLVAETDAFNWDTVMVAPAPSQ